MDLLRYPLSAAVVWLFLFSGILIGEAQVVPSASPSITWTPAGASTNWFAGTNWTPGRVPTVNDDVGIGNPVSAEILNGAAVARSVTLGTFGQFTEGNALGSLNVAGAGSSLNITPITTDTPGLQILQQSALTVSNGGLVALNLAGSIVDNFGTINIGSGGLGGTIISDVIRNDPGQTFPAGAININLTDTTVINADIQGAGTITKTGTGNVIFESGVAGASLIVNDGTAVVADAGTLSAPVTVSGASSVLRISGGSGASLLTIENGGSLDNAGTLNGFGTEGAEITLGPGIANVINRSTGSITSGAGNGDGLEFTSGGTLQNSGQIAGTNGLTLDSGGSVTNNAGGRIQGIDGSGVLSSLPFSGVVAPSTVVNSGTIIGATNGIDLQNGGSIINNAGGSVRGSQTGGSGITNAPRANPGLQPQAALVLDPSALTIVNSGTIGGAIGIDLTVGGGSITNNAGGTVLGFGGTAISVAGGPTAFVNAGSIVGNVILDPLLASNAVLISGGTILGGLDLGTNGGTTLTLDGTGAQLLSQAVTGLITNDGAVIKQGAGTWIIDKSLGAIPGGLTITGGTLTLAVTDAVGTGAITVTGQTSLLGVSPGVTLANPLAINEGGTLDNAGTITNTRIVVTSAAATSRVINESQGVIIGTGGLAIASSNGPTVISNAGAITGSISLGSGANTVQLVAGGSIAGNLNLGTNASSNLVLDGTRTQLVSQAVTGTITNPGSLIKQGSGNWIVDRFMDAPISTNVLAGVLTVNSNLRSPLVTVQTGAMLKGAGNVIGNVTNFGTLNPGNSPGTLTIDGNFIQGASGVYNVQIDSATNYSRLIVTGHATLDGALRLTLASGYKPSNGTQFKILTAGQGISGTFKEVTSNQVVNVTYGNGVVNVNAGPKAQEPGIHLSDGTPVSTTALIANNTFYGFGSLSQRSVLGLVPGNESGNGDGSGSTIGGNGELLPTNDGGRGNTVSVTFDAGEFEIHGDHGEVYGLPIAGGFKINDRVRLNYEIPLQYVRVAGTSLFQAGLTLDLPTKVIVTSADQPWSWDVTPTIAFATSGSKEILGGAALSNLVTYRWRGMSLTYGNYMSFFEGSRLTSNDAQFPSAVDQQIMKNGLRVDIPFAKTYIFEAYGIHTNFFQTAQISSYFTIGFEVGHHFIWNYAGQNVDLGYLSLGFYSDFGNHYSSGHGQIGSAWRF